MTQRIEFHQIAEIFPMLPDAELHELAEDIKRHGLRSPILLFEGKVLDGRNRAIACEMAGADAQYEIFTGTTTEEAINYVLSTNLHRRHLTDQQKYRAIKKASEIREKAQQRQSQGRKEGGHIAGRGRPRDRLPAETAGNLSDIHKEPHEGEVVFDIAKMLDISPRKVYQMEQIEREAPELLRDAVDRGEVSVNAASIVISGIEKNELTKIIEETKQSELPRRVQAEAKKAKGKKKKATRNLHVENPFKDIDRIDMMLVRLQQYWGEITPALRTEFLAWVAENREQYPTEEVLANE